MIEVEASVEIDRTPQFVWGYVSQLDSWWLGSNPKEHIELSVIGQGRIGPGTEMILKERIAGIRGEAIITVSEFQPSRTLVWKSLTAQYKVLGIGIAVKEGGTFRIAETENGCVLSHRVWGKLEGITGAAAEWIFRHILKGERKDYEHTHRELVYIKRELESRPA